LLLNDRRSPLGSLGKNHHCAAKSII